MSKLTCMYKWRLSKKFAQPLERGEQMNLCATARVLDEARLYDHALFLAVMANCRTFIQLTIQTARF